MNKKDIIVISVLVNAGLLVILLISALTSKESYLVASSAQVASSILQKDAEGMSSSQPASEENSLSALTSGLEMNLDETPRVDGEIVHQLPEIAAAPSSVSEVALPEVMAPFEQKEPAISVSAEKDFEAKCIEIKVKSGDSLDRLAKKYHVSIGDIQRANNLSGSFLRKGQNLKIPTRVKALAKTSGALENSSRYYTVKPGDNPWTVAMKHHLKVEDLLKMNNLDRKKAKKLQAGDKLRVR
ncbi:MAG: LysM peptidoglycan-binding domain-containing protein [Parachlamydiales bacterium]|jgi:LysM repeat protein